MAEFVIDPDTLYGASTSPNVFWGYSEPGEFPTTVPGGAGTNGAWKIPGMKGTAPKYLTKDQALGYLWTVGQTDPKLYEQYRQRMFNAGLIDKDATGMDMQRVWQDAVATSITAAGNGTNITPWDAIDLLGGAAGGGNGRFTGTRTTPFSRTSTNTDTRRSVDLSSASEARAFLLAAAERELGRAATTDEIAAFRRALNAEEQANPETTVTKSKQTDTGSSTQNIVDDVVQSESSTSNSTSSTDSTSSGGMDRAQFSLDFARSRQDYAEYQAATTYANALFAALGSPVNVEG